MSDNTDTTPSDIPSYTTTEEELIPAWLADNYDELIQDPDRGLTYETFASQHEQTEPALAAWARRRAAQRGEDTTPVHATPEPPQAIRYDELTVPALTDIAKERGIDPAPFKVKADLIGALEAHDAAQSTGGDPS